MGSFSGGSSALSRAIDSLREEFGPDRYNVLTRNCNTFSSALCEELVGRPIPGYVNRLAWMGEKRRGGEGGGGGTCIADRLPAFTLLSVEYSAATPGR